MMSRIRQRLRALLPDQTGAALAIIAAAMPVLCGAGALGVETGLWYLDKRGLQTAADAAALSGAFERVRGNSTGLHEAAEREAVRNGFVMGGPNQLTINNPPTSGPMAGETTAVEVILSRPHETLFASLLLDGPVTIAARSVAAVDVKGEACVLALDGAASASFLGQGSTIVNMPGCTMASNSVSSSAIQISGSATVIAHSLWTAGGVLIGGSSETTLERPATQHAWALRDPLADMTVPPFVGCDYVSPNLNDTETFPLAMPASGQIVICGDLSFGSQADVTLLPGIYIIDGGDFRASAGSEVHCDCPDPEDGVTFILTSSGDFSDVGIVHINGGANVDLRAPASIDNPFRGVLFYQDRRTTNTAESDFNGGATMSLAGSIYFPRSEVNFQGNNTQTGCTQIVAREVTFIGNSTINNTGCQAAGVEPITVTAARLTE